MYMYPSLDSLDVVVASRQAVLQDLEARGAGGGHLVLELLDVLVTPETAQVHTGGQHTQSKIGLIDAVEVKG